MSPFLEILALGARGPVGLSAPTFAAAVRAGIGRVAEHPFMVDRRGNPIPAALEPTLDPKLPVTSRLVHLARGALQEAVGWLPPAFQQPGTLEVLLALPECRPGFSSRDAETVVAGVRERFFAELVGQGHAGALEALRVAREHIATRRSRLCAIVGADSYFHADTIDWLDENRQIATEGVRDGFALGEAGGCLVVTDRETSKALGVMPCARLRNVASASERDVIKGMKEGLGMGLSVAIGTATEGLRLPDEAIDATYCDINGERYRTQEWAFTLLRTPAAFRTTDYVSLVSSCGDVGAASGVLLCVLAVRAWARAYAKGRRSLVWCSSEAGLRSAAVLESPSVW